VSLRTGLAYGIPAFVCARPNVLSTRFDLRCAVGSDRTPGRLFRLAKAVLEDNFLSRVRVLLPQP
jgi:hypothetical protein